MWRRTYRFPRVGGDAAALEPRHVRAPERVLGQTRESRQVYRVGINSWTFFQDATSFLALKHMVEQTRKDRPEGGGLSHSRYHVYGSQCCDYDPKTIENNAAYPLYEGLRGT
jgi:hypothetical protein